MTHQEVLKKLCTYDIRNPNYLAYDDEDLGKMPQNCACDNCFYGRTRMALHILKLERESIPYLQHKYENWKKEINEYENKQ